MPDTLERFDYLQQQMQMRIDRSAGLALDRLRLVSPFNAHVKYNLYATFCIIATHQRRHLWQAEQVEGETLNCGLRIADCGLQITRILRSPVASLSPDTFQQYVQRQREAVEAALACVAAGSAGVSAAAGRGDALQPRRRRQAPAPHPHARGGRRHRHRRRPRRRRGDVERAGSGAGPAGGVRHRVDPHLLADPRRPAGDGRRHAAAGASDAPCRVRRRRRDPGRRWPAHRGVRAARARAASGADAALALRKLRVIERIATAAGAPRHGRRTGRGPGSGRHDRNPRTGAAVA